MKTHSALKTSDAWRGYLFILPAVAVLGTFGVYPLVYAGVLSVSSAPRDGGGFVGLAHYADALRTEAFWDSVRVTLWYAIGTVPVTIALSVMIGLALFRMRGVSCVPHSFCRMSPPLSPPPWFGANCSRRDPAW